MILPETNLNKRETILDEMEAADRCAMRQKGTHHKLNGKVYNYKTVIKPTMTHRAECWAVRKKVENRLNVVEMRMLRWIRAKGKTRKDHVRNQVNTRGCESMPNVNIPETEISLLLYEPYANVSSQICSFLALRPQFHSNPSVNLSTPRYCQSATFGRLTFCVYPKVAFLRNSRLMSPRPQCARHAHRASAAS